MVDIQPTTIQPISDDQELAKALAGVGEETGGTPSMQFEETPSQQAAPQVAPLSAAPTAPATDSLGSIKTAAITELRPLVDKLNLPPEDKFDTYLLLIRSTDDTTLIAPAHQAAQSITDEAKKAQALLDIIREIDYLSTPQNPVA